MLQVCLNGSRDPAEHPALPRSPADFALAAREAVDAGAEDIHLHPKAPDGRDSLDPSIVDAVIMAVREAVPQVTIGVTTGAWATPDPSDSIRMWTVLPDHASVNWHEDAAEHTAQALLDRGIAVHAGIWTGTDGAARFKNSPQRRRVQRILAEVMAPESGLAEQLLAELRGYGRILLHGEGEATWPVLRHAVKEGLDARIGLEDTLVLPDGSPARGNADLVRAALELRHPA